MYETRCTAMSLRHVRFKYIPVLPFGFPCKLEILARQFPAWRTLHMSEPQLPTDNSDVVVGRFVSPSNLHKYVRWKS